MESRPHWLPPVAFCDATGCGRNAESQALKKGNAVSDEVIGGPCRSCGQQGDFNCSEESQFVSTAEVAIEDMVITETEALFLEKMIAEGLGKPRLFVGISTTID